MWWWLACGGPAVVPDRTEAPARVEPKPASDVPKTDTPAAEAPAAPLPPGLPAEVVHEGACPFECCNYNDHWVPSADVPLRAAIDGDPIGTVPAKSTIQGITGTVKVKPGVARVTRAYTLQAEDGSRIQTQPGKLVYTLDNLGEGFANVWYEGKTYQGEAWFLVEPCTDRTSDGCWAETVTAPKQRWWAKVKTATGQEGWIDMDNAAPIGGVDGCG